MVFPVFKPLLLTAFFFSRGLFMSEASLAKSASQKDEKLLDFKKQELALKVTKEIMVKFIEIGRVTPSSFQETFRSVHSEVKKGLHLKD